MAEEEVLSYWSVALILLLTERIWVPRSLGY